MAVSKERAFSHLLDIAALKFMLRGAVNRDPVLKVIQGQLATGSVFYDIGACIGLYSIFLARAVENCLIYSFEPNPQSYVRLTNNIRFMKLQDRIVPQRIALGADAGQRMFYISSDPPRSSLHDYNAKSDDNTKWLVLQ